LKRFRVVWEIALMERCDAHQFVENAIDCAFGSLFVAENTSERHGDQTHLATWSVEVKIAFERNC